MKKNDLRKWLFAFLILSLESNITIAQPRDRWNGTVSYTWRNSTKSPTRTAVTELRLVALVTDGIAATKASERSSMNQTQNCEVSSSGYAEGEGSAPFDMSFYDGIYSVEVAMPYIKGQKKTQMASKCGGGEKLEDIGLGEHVLLVEEMKAGDNPDILMGDTTIRTVTKGGHKETLEEVVTITWNLTRGPLELNLIVTPSGYNEWLPIPGKSEIEAGSTMTISLQLKDKDGKTPNLKAKVFELELQRTSKEPGIALNRPLEPASNPKFDFSFPETDQAVVTNEGQHQRIVPEDGHTTTFMINCFDGGGYTTLIVDAVLENGRRIRGVLEKPGGETNILIPKRKPGSFIAEAWLSKYGDPADLADEDKSPGNDNAGDGLSAYEEYRGLFSEGEYKRLSPALKELGVQVLKKDRAAFSEGMQLLAKASGIVVLPLFEDELDPERKLNLNAKTAHKQDQFALKLENDKIGVAGHNEPATKENKTPKDSKRAVVDLNQLSLEYVQNEAQYKSINEPMPFTLKESIATTVAHELGHGIGMDHHGPPSGEIPRTIVKSDSARFRVYGINFLRVSCDDTCKIQSPIGRTGNESSGDLSCIMAYTNSYNWAFNNRDGLLIYEAVPLLPVGNKVCTSPHPTGINRKGYFGAATKGNCLGRLHVRDK